MTPSRNSTSKSDILTRSELIYCALAALGLHILLIFIFGKDQNVALEQATGDRTNILFAENDPNFKQISQKINAEPDPAQFIRGGNTGYSSCYTFEARQVPESKNELPVFTAETEQSMNSTLEPPPPDLNRTYAEMFHYTPHAEKKENEPAALDARYPIWKDAFGIMQNFNKVYGGYNSTISINSNSVNSPTVLKIHFPPKKAKAMPTLVTIHTSCGDTFLDDYAKKILLERLSDADFLKKFNPEYNDMVYIYWQPDLKAVETEAFPRNMFPGEKL